MTSRTKPEAPPTAPKGNGTHPSHKNVPNRQLPTQRNQHFEIRGGGTA